MQRKTTNPPKTNKKYTIVATDTTATHSFAVFWKIEIKTTIINNKPWKMYEINVALIILK